MAKIRPGGLVGQIRGSIGGDTFSQNRYGPYIRNRSIPTIVRSIYTDRVRGAFTLCSQLWQSLPLNWQLEWKTWAQNNPITDRFGEQQVLSGNTAFIKLNTRLLILGRPISPRPPGKTAPPPLESVGLTEITEDYIKVSISPDPPPENTILVIDGYVSDTPGLNYVENRFRMLHYFTKDTAGPIDVKPWLEARFGQLPSDCIVYLRMRLVNADDGQASGYVRIALKYTYT